MCIIDDVDLQVAAVKPDPFVGERPCMEIPVCLFSPDVPFVKGSFALINGLICLFVRSEDYGYIPAVVLASQ